MSDKTRVLAQLRKGPIRREDFLLPDVIDGGKPILHVGARVLDLRNDGHDIATARTKPTATYTLILEAGTPPKSVGFADALRGLDPAEQPHDPYADDDGADWWEAA